MKKKNDVSPRLAGEKAQDEFIKKMELMVAGLEKTLNNIQLEVEPNVNTIDFKPNKKNKKKLN